MVHVSSLTVLGLPRDGRVVDESTLPAPAGDAYSESKLAAERVAADWRGRGLEVTVVRPGGIWGPGDTTLLPRVEALLARGLMPRPGDGGNHLGLAHVANVVDALLLAGSVDAAVGQTYHITDGEAITAREVLGALAAALGVPAPRFGLPVPVLDAVGALCELGGRLLGLRAPPPVTRYGVRLLACDCRYDIGKARRELGYAPRVSFHQGLRELARARTSCQAPAGRRR